MVESGKTLDLRAVRRPVLDKHSSGGVGDKVTLVLAPLVASCGGVFGKMSGRGLGHTGGTLDKLESIPGFRVQLPQGEFVRQLERIGVGVVSQSERIVPADRILYALRDVTATVESDGLIAASIMSKKIASGTSALVLDIKVGRGAFLQDEDHARELARLCRLVGDAYERPVHCVLTAMEAPLGRAVGNRLEVEEAWDVLSGEGPADVREVTLALAAELLALADLGIDRAEGRRRAEEALAAGRAAEHFERWCYVQGGRWKPGEYHRLAGREIKAERPGWLAGVDARTVGLAAQCSGAGRRRVDDVVDPAAGRRAGQGRGRAGGGRGDCWRRCMRARPAAATRRRPCSRAPSPSPTRSPASDRWSSAVREPGPGGVSAGARKGWKLDERREAQSQSVLLEALARQCVVCLDGHGHLDRCGARGPQAGEEPRAEQLTGERAAEAHRDVPGAEPERRDAAGRGRGWEGGCDANHFQESRFTVARHAPKGTLIATAAMTRM